MQQGELVDLRGRSTSCRRCGAPTTWRRVESPVSGMLLHIDQCEAHFAELVASGYKEA